MSICRVIGVAVGLGSALGFCGRIERRAERPAFNQNTHLDWINWIPAEKWTQPMH